MTIYVRKNGKFVNKHTGEPMLPNDWASRPVAMPRVISDLPAYRSPVTGDVIEGRWARREDMKKHGCREVDPSERQDYQNIKYERKYSADAQRIARNT